jgi:hypothetical protein
MTRTLIDLVTCPFCPTGRARVSADLTALRAVEGRADHAHLPTAGHPAVVFDGGGPCEHLADLAVALGWEPFAQPRGSRPGGVVNAVWSHPAAGPDGRSRVVGGTAAAARYPGARHEGIDLLGAFRGPPGRLAWFVTPDPDAEPPARPGGEAGWWWAEADAVFDTDPERLFRSALATEAAETRR